MQRHKEDVDPIASNELVADEADENSSGSKSKRELKKAIKKEKHAKLNKYLERKRLRDEFEYIDGWF